MATSIADSNTDKIDQLARQVADLKATLRLSLWIAGLGVAILVALMLILMARTSDTPARLQQITYRLEELRELQSERIVQLKGASKK